MNPAFAHVVDTYWPETQKTASVWSGFQDEDWGYRPHPKSSTVGEILRHQILSERRFFAEFLAFPELAASELLPASESIGSYKERYVELAKRRLAFLESRDADWWSTPTRFFDVERQRIWVFWRRVLHTAHHRTQLTVYLRLLDRVVPSTYGPTADVTWAGADPTLTVDAAERK